jgi:Domain of unknown function (DUF4365)
MSSTDLPIVTEADETGELGLRLVMDAVAKAGHIFRSTEKRDFGIDGQIEIIVDGMTGRHATGRLIALQIKCGPSYLAKEVEAGYVLYCSTAHANYWQTHSLPVLIVLCDPGSGECHWTLVDSNSLIRTREGAKVIVPKHSRLAASGELLAKIALAGRVKTSDADAPIFVFPIDSNYGIGLSDDELEVLCAEASLALSRPLAAGIEIQFSNEELVAAEADILRSMDVPSVEHRKRLLELEHMHDWFSAKRRHLTKGMRWLLSDQSIRTCYLNTMDIASTARAVAPFSTSTFSSESGMRCPGRSCSKRFLAMGRTLLSQRFFWMI